MSGPNELLEEMRALSPSTLHLISRWVAMHRVAKFVSYATLDPAQLPAHQGEVRALTLLESELNDLLRPQ